MKTKYIIEIFSSFLIGLLIGFPVGSSYPISGETARSLQRENTALGVKINQTKTEILTVQTEILALTETINITPLNIPPPKIVAELTPQEYWALFTSKVTGGGYDSESVSEVTTKDEIERFLSALCADPTYQELHPAFRPFVEFAYLKEWDNRLVVGWVTLSQPFPVLIVKEENGYEVYKIIEGTLKPLEIIDNALIYIL